MVHLEDGSVGKTDTEIEQGPKATFLETNRKGQQ
jgi:hypothetical protein